MTKFRNKSKAFSMDLPYDLTTQLVDKVSALQSSVKADYLKEKMLSKFVSDDTDPPIVRRNRAIFKWLCAEQDNEATNDRLLLTHEEYNILPRVAYGRFVEWCREAIRDIIGDSPPVEALIGSFSGGASTSRPRTKSHPAFKYAGKAHITPRCLEWWNLLGDEAPGWLGEQGILLIEEVPGNVLFTVPKKTDIDRVACKEPDLNMFIQKGVGTYFRKCLRRAGINLNDQSRNQSLARLGSVTGKLATLDLSSASDSVTTELVFQLLPETWYTLLDASRCHITVIDGDEHRNHMFSSMGNGFTFELESLLFFVISRAVAHFTNTRGVVSVYGDDIICNSDMAQDLVVVLNYFGFQVNLDKSYFEGPFRESCGGHYHDGFDITPFYIGEPIRRMDDLIDVANKLRRWAHSPYFGVLDPEVEEIWLWLKGHIPRCLWGGVDLSFKYQLVSRDTPEMRLAEEVKRTGTGIGGYFHWLNATWDREGTSDGVATSRRSANLGRYRLKRSRISTVNRLDHLFLHEI